MTPWPASNHAPNISLLLKQMRFNALPTLSYPLLLCSIPFFPAPRFPPPLTFPSNLTFHCFSSPHCPAHIHTPPPSSHIFLPAAAELQKQRRSPLINRGYYARVTAVWELVQRFLSVAGEKAQVLSLGAGYDTLFWRLMEHGAVFSDYYEVDYPEVLKMKEMTRKHSRLLALPDGASPLTHTHTHQRTHTTAPTLNCNHLLHAAVCRRIFHCHGDAVDSGAKLKCICAR